MQQLALVLDERTPHRPYCTDDLRAGLRIRTRRAALRLPYIQANPPHLRFWMLHDIDRPGGALAWEDAGLPPPAWAAINRDNMHAHLAWGLSAPVLTGDAGRAEPIRYLCAIESAYRAALDADPGYSGLITKNPLHERWQVLHGTSHLYDLDELAREVDLTKHLPKRGAKVEQIGLGRNCALFDDLRHWAYVAVRRHREARNFVLWQAEAYNKALERNGDFRQPLDYREAYHVAASVARWTWKRDAQARAKFSARQAWKGRKGGIASGAARLAASEDKRSSARLMATQGRSLRAIASELGVNPSTVSRWIRG